MDAILWNDSYSVKIASIDEQQRLLFAYINKFYDQLGRLPNDELTRELVDNLNHYARVHFEYQEELMRRFDYAGLPQHHVEHQMFVSYLADVNERLKRHESLPLFEVPSYVEAWLVSHVKGSDQTFVEDMLSTKQK